MQEDAMLETMMTWRDKLLAKVETIGWLGPALVRLTVGVVFMGTGWGKLHSLDKVTAFFTDLHLPAPHFQAVLVASTELICGTLILVGLLTRLAAIPLMITMLVAILTAKRGDIDGVTTLLGFEEVSYLVMLVWLAVAGPGKLSLDYLLGKRLGTKRQPKLGGEPLTA